MSSVTTSEEQERNGCPDGRCSLPVEDPTDRLVVLFDGECAFCLGWTRFLLERDRLQRLSFLPLGSQQAADLLKQRGLPHPGFDSMAVVDGHWLLTQSSAALRIAAVLPFPWRACGILRLVPLRLRDAVYRAIARRRHRLVANKKPRSG